MHFPGGALSRASLLRICLVLLVVTVLQDGRVGAKASSSSTEQFSSGFLPKAADHPVQHWGGGDALDCIES